MQPALRQEFAPRLRILISYMRKHNNSYRLSMFHPWLPGGCWEWPENIIFTWVYIPVGKPFIKRGGCFIENDQ